MVILDFKKNLGDKDRLARVILGLILLTLVITKAITDLWAALAVVIAFSQFIEGQLAY